MENSVFIISTGDFSHNDDSRGTWTGVKSVPGCHARNFTLEVEVCGDQPSHTKGYGSYVPPCYVLCGNRDSSYLCYPAATGSAH